MHVYLRRALLSSAVLRRRGTPPARARARRLGDGAEPAMDFGDSPEEAEFRARFRAWLVDNNPGLPASSTDDEYWAKQAEWHCALFDGGFFALTLAQGAIGGQELPTVFEVIVDEELAAGGRAAAARASATSCRASPVTAATRSATGSCPGSISGRDRWCQGFSEPDAGSDLASLRTRRGARRRRVRDRRATRSGPATPTSPTGACSSRAPTPTSPKHKGISAFAVPMRPARHRAAAAEDDQRHHQRVRPGAVRRRACARREHDRRAG